MGPIKEETFQTFLELKLILQSAEFCGRIFWLLILKGISKQIATGHFSS